MNDRRKCFRGGSSSRAHICWIDAQIISTGLPVFRWNNIRMAMETALVMSHAMGRTLVLP